MNSKKTVDVIIVGAGAAGLMAAAIAARRGKTVLLLEKNRKLGVKILMSGGTRCNITHHCDAREIATAFGRQGKFLLSPLSALGPPEVVQFSMTSVFKQKSNQRGRSFRAATKPSTFATP